MLGDADGLFYQAVTAAAYEATDGHEHTSACSEQTIMPWRPQYNVCIVAKKWPLAIVKVKMAAFISRSYAGLRTVPIRISIHLVRYSGNHEFISKRFLHSSF